MKRIASIFLGILLLISFSCKNETKKELKNSQKKPSKNLVVVKRKKQLLPTKEIKDAVKKNEQILKIYESFSPETYSIDELIDIVEKDLKIFKQTKGRPFRTKIDTAAVKSRLILTEINLKKLDFLLHQKQPSIDTIEKTLNAIISNLNGVTQQIKLYSSSTDEFEDILVKDSILQAKKDSLPTKIDSIISRLAKQKILPKPVTK